MSCNMNQIVYGREDFYDEEVVLLIEKGLFNQTFGKESEVCRRQFAEGNFTALKDCPFVLGGTGTVDGRIGLEVMKMNEINEPIIRSRSNNSNFLLKLAAEGMGGCFCPKCRRRRRRLCTAPGSGSNSGTQQQFRPRSSPAGTAQ